MAALSARGLVVAARVRNDDLAVLGVCSHCAWTFVRTGLEAEAATMVDELLARRRERPWGVAPGWWTVAIALTLERLGRSGELLALPEPEGSRFVAAARSIDARRFAEGAETLRAVGAAQFEAEARVLAAREARTAGDAAGAEGQLERARELLRRLGADARVQQLTEAKI